MPEGPEVKKIGEALASRICGRKLLKFHILSGRYSKKCPENLGYFGNNLPTAIIGPGVHGKFIYIILENGWTIWNTLGMTGSWSTEREKHTRIEIELNDGKIFYNDQRNFGTVKLVKEKYKLVEKLSSLGPDMLSDNVPDHIFITQIRKKDKKTIAEVLMDQKVIAGVGNYIKAESLYLARISPHRVVLSLTDSELCNLKNKIQEVMKESFRSGGATIRTYKNFDGTIGEYGSRFIVYNQKTDPMGNQVIKEATKDKRTTHWVPELQK